MQNRSLLIAKNKFLNEISESERTKMLASAASGIEQIIKMEPRLIETNGELTLSIQPDSVAKKGDIRDVLIVRGIDWEIGISLKHNHEALKHSRLSAKLDFGNSWFGIPSSEIYFNEISGIFQKLEELKLKNVKWKELPNKALDIYVPILGSFTREFHRLYKKSPVGVVEGIIKYLLGSEGNDYYKLIHHDNHIAKIIPLNISGTLNKPSKTQQPEIIIPNIKLPTRIIELAFKKNSKTTVHLTMDNGWAISFRIHNAKSTVEPSLKFDIKLIGQPASLFFIKTRW